MGSYYNFLAPRELCSGCAACAYACPRGAITMQFDGEGFSCPVVSSDRCVSCGKCTAICPIKTPLPASRPISYYAARSVDYDVLRRSTSGGVAYEAGKRCVEENGIFYGCFLDKQSFEIKHIGVEDVDQVTMLSGSKYAQSDVSQVYSQIDAALKLKRKVVFCGTPCQTAGLRKCFGNVENLVLIAIICRGVPSPQVFKKWVCELGERHRSRVSSVRFREKTHGWDGSECVVGFVDGSTESIPYRSQPMRLCMDICPRKSCYSCLARRDKSGSDLIIGDFWGVQFLENKSFDDDRGVSCVLVQTRVGWAFLKTLNLSMFPVSSNEVTRENKALEEDVPICPRRAQFYRILRHSNIENAIKVAKFGPLWIRALRKVKRLIKKYTLFAADKR